MKLWEAMKLLEEDPTDVYEAKITPMGFTLRMSVSTGKSRYFKFDVFYGEKLIEQSSDMVAFNRDVAMNLDWQPVRQPVPWQEAIEAWADGKEVSYSYTDSDLRYGFEDSNTMMRPEKIKNAKWYVED